MAATAITTRTTSELWFEAYLREHGIDGADDHHPDVGSSLRPDYRVQWGDDSAIFEAKEFKTTKADERFAAAPRQPDALSPDEVYGAIRVRSHTPRSSSTRFVVGARHW